MFLGVWEEDMVVVWWSRKNRAKFESYINSVVSNRVSHRMETGNGDLQHGMKNGGTYVQLVHQCSRRVHWSHHFPPCPIAYEVHVIRFLSLQCLANPLLTICLIITVVIVARDSPRRLGCNAILGILHIVRLLHYEELRAGSRLSMFIATPGKKM